MKTGSKIAIFYTLISLAVVILSVSVFMFVFFNSNERLYFESLEQKAVFAAQVMWEKDEMGHKEYDYVLSKYDESLPVLEEIHLNADHRDSVIETLAPYFEESDIKQLYKGKVLHYNEGNKLGVAIYYPDNEGNFIVFLLSNDSYESKLFQRVSTYLIFLLFLVIVILYLSSKLYAVRKVDMLDNAYRREKAFVHHASHELNNPLTAILGLCEIAERKQRTAEEFADMLLRISSEAHRMNDVLNQLLILAGNNSTNLQLKAELIHLKPLLGSFSQQRVHIDFQTQSDPVVLGNPHLFSIAIRNVINNALKYSKPNQVEVTLSEQPNNYSLAIIDQGIGIPKKDISRIFRPFFRSQNAQSFEQGQGVGLHLAQRIFISYNVQIEIHSKEGQGTNLTLHFPKIPTQGNKLQR